MYTVVSLSVQWSISVQADFTAVSRDGRKYLAFSHFWPLTAATLTSVHCTALHCTALYCTTLRCTALDYTALHCCTLHFIALSCTALHYTAQHCKAMQCNTMETKQCNVLHFPCVFFNRPGEAGLFYKHLRNSFINFKVILRGNIFKTLSLSLSFRFWFFFWVELVGGGSIINVAYAV